MRWFVVFVLLCTDFCVFALFFRCFVDNLLYLLGICCDLLRVCCDLLWVWDVGLAFVALCFEFMVLVWYLWFVMFPFVFEFDICSLGICCGFYGGAIFAEQL